MDRLNFVASLTKGLESIADVGCDHAYTSIKAIKEYHVKHAYALDLNPSPLEMAKKNIEEALLQDKIDLILSDGLKSFDKEADGLIITGMGGLLIKKILEESLPKVKKFKKMILGPNLDGDKLRYYLISNGFNIIDEYMIFDKKKYYEIIICDNLKPTRKYDYFDMKFGPILRVKKPKEFIELYQKKLDISLEALKSVSDEAKRSKILLDINMYRRILGND